MKPRGIEARGQFETALQELLRVHVATQASCYFRQHAQRRHVVRIGLEVGPQTRIRDGQIVVHQCGGGGHETRVVRRCLQVARARLVSGSGIAASVVYVGQQAPAIRGVRLQLHGPAQSRDGFRRPAGFREGDTEFEEDSHRVRLLFCERLELLERRVQLAVQAPGSSEYEAGARFTGHAAQDLAGLLGGKVCVFLEQPSRVRERHFQGSDAARSDVAHHVTNLPRPSRNGVTYCRELNSYDLKCKSATRSASPDTLCRSCATIAPECFVRCAHCRPLFSEPLGAVTVQRGRWPPQWQALRASSNVRSVDIREASGTYERWLMQQVPVLRGDLDLKHRLMTADLFSFFRATFYRWAQLWPETCPESVAAPTLLSVGDLHVENFGTWRDAEGRLIWGVNDFDEAAVLPYTQDLVRLACSAQLAIQESRLTLSVRSACESIIEGYTESMRTGGGAAVLAERYRWLRELAIARLKDQRPYWEAMRGLRSAPGRANPRVRRLLEAAMPARGLELRFAHRQAGLGSLGRVRLVALANWRGGMVAREAKPLAGSAWAWAHGGSQRAAALSCDRAQRGACAGPVPRAARGVAHPAPGPRLQPYTPGEPAARAR